MQNPVNGHDATNGNSKSKSFNRKIRVDSDRGLTYQYHHVSREQRKQTIGSRVQGYRSGTIWLTGLSGAGKSSIAFELERYLVSQGVPAYCLDADNLRFGLTRNLQFSLDDRHENVRRVAETAKLFAESGMIVVCSIISPFTDLRKLVRSIHESEGLPFFEIFVNTPLEVCEARDVKGLYKRVRAGEITNFTGVNQPYEIPERPDLIVSTETCTLEQSTARLIDFLEEKGMIPKLFSPNRPTQELFVDPSRLSELKTLMERSQTLEINQVDVQWLQVLAEGWASPLKGFMRENQYLQVQHFNRIVENGVEVNQSVPIVLALTEEDKKRCQDESTIVLRYEGRNLAILKNPEFYRHRKEERCCRQFGTNNTEHPYVKMIHESGDWLVGGDLEVLERIRWNDGLDQYRLTPNEIKAKCLQVGADAVFAFQLRNPIHNGHTLLMQDTRRLLLEDYGHRKPLLLLHPLGGWTKNDDVPLHVRIQQHQAVLDEGLLHPDTILAIFPSPMMYAGPTEVQWHAKARSMAGVNYFIVGRDPAGIAHPNKLTTHDGNLYDSDHGVKVLSMAPALQGIKIIPFRIAAYDKKQGRISFFDPQRKDDFDLISGTKMRSLAKAGKSPPDGFMALKAWKILLRYYQNSTDN